VPLPVVRDGRSLGKGCCGAPLEHDSALPLGDVARGCESLPRMLLVGAIERQQAFAAPAVDFRQIEADAGLVDRRNCAIEMREAIGRPSGSQQHFARQTEIKLRDRTASATPGPLALAQLMTTRLLARQDSSANFSASAAAR
jgi:hypothetical protein